MIFAALVALTLQVDSPPVLEAAAARIRGVDLERLAADLKGAGLEPPPSVSVTLVPESDAAADAPRWIVGRAFGSARVVIFPERVTQYPYDSLESVLRHEVVHVALTAAAGESPLPRWFHEGVATSVEAGWGVTEQLRLLVAALREPSMDDVSGLFRSEAQHETELAYLLATALVNDLRERHGADLPGRIARRVDAALTAGPPVERRDTPASVFVEAFVAETGVTPHAAAEIAWRSYRTWSRWVPALVSGSAIWAFIIVLATVAFAARRRRRRRRRERWRAEDPDPFDA